jgi:hypothetical protein
MLLQSCLLYRSIFSTEVAVVSLGFSQLQTAVEAPFVEADRRDHEPMSLSVTRDDLRPGGRSHRKLRPRKGGSPCGSPQATSSEGALRVVQIPDHCENQRCFGVLRTRGG